MKHNFNYWLSEHWRHYSLCHNPLCYKMLMCVSIIYIYILWVCIINISNQWLQNKFNLFKFVHNLRIDTCLFFFFFRKNLVKHLQINRANAVINNIDARLINTYHLCILIHKFAKIALLRKIYLTCYNNPCVCWINFLWRGGCGGGGCIVKIY